MTSFEEYDGMSAPFGISKAEPELVPDRPVVDVREAARTVRDTVEAAEAVRGVREIALDRYERLRDAGHVQTCRDGLRVRLEDHTMWWVVDQSPERVFLSQLRPANFTAIIGRSATAAL